MLKAIKSTWLQGNHATPVYSEERNLSKMTVRATDPVLESKLQTVNTLYARIATLHYEIDSLVSFANEQPSDETLQYIQERVDNKTIEMNELIPQYQKALNNINNAVYNKHVLYADKQQEIFNKRAVAENVKRTQVPKAQLNILQRKSTVHAVQSL